MLTARLLRRPALGTPWLKLLFTERASPSQAPNLPLRQQNQCHGFPRSVSEDHHSLSH